MKRIRLKPSATRNARILAPRSRNIDPELARAGLGAESFATIPSVGSPVTLAALRSEILASLRSKGGRPGLEGAERRQKIPMSDRDWQSLEAIAAQISREGVSVTAGQLASRLLSRALEELGARARAEYAVSPPAAGRLRVSEVTNGAPAMRKARERDEALERALSMTVRRKVAA